MVCRKDDDNHNPPLSGEETKGNENTVGTGPSKKSPVPSKKGPWTSEEDAILTDYIKKHGRGNWNAVKKFSGLSRCGKSCRLRWVNHLQSDLKKGPITPEEEDIIVRLHAMIGPKWARIAAKLPGRTDNEVKNFYNTRKKRLQRAGLEIYPKDVLNQNQSNESQQSPISGTLSNELSSSHNLMEASVSDIPVFRVAGSLCSELYSSMFIGSNMHYPAPTMHCQKRLRESDASPCLSDTATSSLFTQLNSNAQFLHLQPCELPPLPESVFGDNSSLQAFHGSHAFMNGAHSTSSPSFGSARLELPSLQSSDSDYSFWDPSLSTVPSVKCTDTRLQSPQVTPSQSHSVPDTDGLLESLVRPSKKVATDPTENETTGDWDNILADISEPDWEALLADNNPPMVSSTAAIFSDLTINGLSFDDLQPNGDVLASDANPETPSTSITSSNPNQNGDSQQQDSWRPDSWLNANLMSPDTEFGKEYLVLQEAISALKGDEHNLQQ